ncbi:deoxycytidylate deaminase, putative [Cordyceps militaris CM01]|uniref:Deoxycytidylate deaminase n=1 Tax=Cordyceps militaris (strain CM01) TaxID=983644 RepID=G3J342_CORMM|nr:deoxycytidylate deaminase, putative [Cordyceps militaris CM01]EGX95625.1 deoxycytidylate deaminase, putative [Cordyceps militaris CM01]
MLIGICGSICSGKKTVAQYLVEHHGFKRLYLRGDNLGVNGIRENASEEATDSGPAAHGSHLPDSLAVRSDHESHTFDTAEALLDFVTLSWRSRFVTTDIPTEKALDVLLRRPFFMLLSTDAPLLVRWRRHSARLEASGTAGASPLSLDAFAAENDRHLFCPRQGLQPLISRATVRLLNTSPSLAHLYATLGTLDIPNPERLRPGWDTYFMSLAALAAQRSNCMKRRVGCVLVGEGHRVVSTGYNGTPRGLRNCADGGCPRCNSGHSSGVGLATCLCLHAEENALLEAGRDRIRGGSVLYCDTCPCLTCSIKICQVGISEVVYAHGYSMDTETAAVFRQAGVKLRQFTPPPNGLIHLTKMDLH